MAAQIFTLNEDDTKDFHPPRPLREVLEERFQLSLKALILEVVEKCVKGGMTPTDREDYIDAVMGLQVFKDAVRLHAMTTQPPRDLPVPKIAAGDFADKED